MNLKELEEIVKGHSKRIEELEAQIKVPGVIGPSKKKLSIKEFLLTKKPKSKVLIMLCIGYYLEKYEDITAFNMKDIENGFRSAKETLPKNLNDIAGQNTKNGYFMPEKNKKDSLLTWTLTSSGERFVETDFKK